jgi:hypothetical protein
MDYPTLVRPPCRYRRVRPPPAALGGKTVQRTCNAAATDRIALYGHSKLISLRRPVREKHARLTVRPPLHAGTLSIPAGKLCAASARLYPGGRLTSVPPIVQPLQQPRAVPPSCASLAACCWSSSLLAFVRDSWPQPAAADMPQTRGLAPMRFAPPTQQNLPGLQPAV